MGLFLPKTLSNKFGKNLHFRGNKICLFATLNILSTKSTIFTFYTAANSKDWAEN